MPRIHEMPTHLNVEDTLLGPLTPRQLVRLAVGLSLAYGAWDQFTVVPDPVRAGLACLLALVGVLVACWRPGGVGLDAWALAALAFGLAPRRLAWARPEPDPPTGGRPRRPTGPSSSSSLSWAGTARRLTLAVARPDWHPEARP